MHNLYHLLLRILRKSYSILMEKHTPIRKNALRDPEMANKIIYELLSTGKPCMIARYGANELNAMVNYIGVMYCSHNVLDYIKGKIPQWWWNENVLKQMAECAGFFPATHEYISRFGELMIEDSKQLDILGSWLINEKFFQPIYGNIPHISLPFLEPFHSNNPWTRWLEGKRIVVIHPFAHTISNQYAKRSLLFKNKKVLPDFASLRLIPAVQSIGGRSDGFNDWFHALNWMKDELDKEDYDIALIGCGAYGFPLAAHSKRTGHQAVHLGGALQLLFGIKGNRWEGDAQCIYWEMPLESYRKHFNSHWVKPAPQEVIQGAEKVENAAYW